MTRAVLESDNAKLTGREILVTLHDSLMARLDRLGPAKEVLQVGAVIGSEFSYELLHAVHPFAEEDLQGALRKLADAELIYPRGIPPEASYTFKHALIHDAAYEALLRSRRKDLHRRVAHTIDEKYAALKEMHPEVLAHHWTEAGEIEPAIAEWFRAGETARARNAFNEALESYQKAVAVLNLLPESPERDLRELELRQSAAQMLYVTRGYAAPETTDAIEHAAALAKKTGNLTLLVTWAMRRWLAPFNSGDLPVAIALADQTFELAFREGSPSNIGMAHAMQTLTRYHCGDLAGAEQHFTAGLKFFDDPAFRQVPGAALWTFAQASYNAWILGRADVARKRMAQMTAFVNRNSPYDLAISQVAAAELEIF
jgi:tetratricopeptide (TPR) repeat protein